MSLFQKLKTVFVGLCLALILVVTSGCAVGTPTDRVAKPLDTYTQLEHGDTASGENFGGWVVQTAGGLVQDAYVRDNNQLGVVISSNVRPKEVRPLAKSLVQGFHNNFPNRDLTVRVYAPDRQLILTVKYDDSTRQIEYL